MTRRTALEGRLTNPNPDCDVCRGSGSDPVFGTDCTECWPDARLRAHREEAWHARRQRMESDLAAERRQEAIDLAWAWSVVRAQPQPRRSATSMLRNVN